MAGQILYGQDDKKKKPDATLPGPAIAGGWGGAPPMPPRSAAVPPPQAPPPVIQPSGTERPQASHGSTLPMPPAGGPAVSELRPYTPGAGGYASFGPSTPPATIAAADRATTDLLSRKNDGGAKLFGGRSVQQLIEDVSNKYGGMENLRARSTSQMTDTQESASRPYTGSYLEGLLQRGPSNRLENILLRRYYGNVGQQTRMEGSRQDTQSTLGVSAAPDLLRDILNAMNESERIGVTGQTQALDTVMTGRSHAAANATSGFNQAVQSGTALAGNEMDATARMFDSGTLGGGRRSAADTFMSQNPDVIMGEDGLPDPAKVAAVRRSIPETTLPNVPGGAPAGGPQARGGPAGPSSLPQSYIADLQGKGWKYAGKQTNKQGQPVHVFLKPGQQPFEVTIQ